MFVVTASFADSQVAERAVNVLVALGVSRDDIVITRSGRAETPQPGWPEVQDARRGEYAAHGEHLGSLENAGPDPEGPTPFVDEDTTALPEADVTGTFTRVSFATGSHTAAQGFEQELASLRPVSLAVRRA
ncbi:hypothetical protein P0D69_41625 [Paraburkholderia sediminicola]|uniref:hypothetical protein n=1 Tax=Paraburkholderia sediminicola TaxID=458836 RepID=UPI0038BB2053